LDPEPSLALLLPSDSNLIYGLVALVLLLFCSALLSAAEVVLFSLTQKDLTDISQKNPFTSRLISQLILKPKKLVSTLTVAKYFTTITVVISFFWLFEHYQFKFVSTTVSFVIKIISISFLLLLFGEILPKVYASYNKLRLALIVVYPLVIFEKVATPISFPLVNIADFLQNRFGFKKTNFSVDQLSQALELTSTDDTTHEEQKILEGIVTFGNTDTKQVMSPRIDLFALEITESFADIYPKIVEKGYSRIPIYKDNIDHIQGVLFVKDLIPHINKKEFDWNALIREPFFVPENKKLDDLLKEFQSMKSHLAIVVDEYGGTSGIVSLEDVIEEIVGDISDEFDDDDINFSKIDDRNYIFEGKINLKDFFRVIDVDESLFESHKGEAETLAGFILEILGNFPKRRQKIQFDTFVFTIEAVDNKRIKQIKVTLNE
jgi:gliding motility-associated protein GldE